MKTFLNKFLWPRSARTTLSCSSCHAAVELHWTFLQKKLCDLSTVGWHNSELKLVYFSICKILHSNSWLILNVEINELIKATRRSQGYSCSPQCFVFLLVQNYFLTNYFNLFSIKRICLLLPSRTSMHFPENWKMGVLHSLSVFHVGPRANIQVITFSVLGKADYFILGTPHNMLKMSPALSIHRDIKSGYRRSCVKDNGIMFTK